MASADRIWTRPEDFRDSECPPSGYEASGLDYGEAKWAAGGRPLASSPCELVNVGSGERMVSVAAGSLLSMLGLERRNRFGLVIAGIGGALLYRGLTGRCHAYQALNLSTAQEHPQRVGESIGSRLRRRLPGSEGIHITQSLLINRSPETLYDYWHRFENLPNFMTHLQSVQMLDDNRSHWVADAPGIVGGKVEWDAETITDEPHSRIAWRSLPGSTVEHHGSISFAKAPGDRGTAVRVEMKYSPPGGKMGQWISKLFGEDPEQQIHDDLRNFKRLMETGEIPSVAGQPRGLCNQ